MIGREKMEKRKNEKKNGKDLTNTPSNTIVSRQTKAPKC